jgi:hypothetical protein
VCGCFTEKLREGGKTVPVQWEANEIKRISRPFRWTLGGHTGHRPHNALRSGQFDEVGSAPADDVEAFRGDMGAVRREVDQPVGVVGEQILGIDQELGGAKAAVPHPDTLNRQSPEQEIAVVGIRVYFKKDSVPARVERDGLGCPLGERGRNGNSKDPPAKGGLQIPAHVNPLLEESNATWSQSYFDTTLAFPLYRALEFVKEIRS